MMVWMMMMMMVMMMMIIIIIKMDDDDDDDGDGIQIQSYYSDDTNTSPVSLATMINCLSHISRGGLIGTPPHL